MFGLEVKFENTGQIYLKKILLAHFWSTISATLSMFSKMFYAHIALVTFDSSL